MNWRYAAINANFQIARCLATGAVHIDRVERAAWCKGHHLCSVRDVSGQADQATAEELSAAAAVKLAERIFPSLWGILALLPAAAGLGATVLLLRRER